ncbi:serine hydrolase domain-containing protein [Paenibacillus thalictri]|uniref:Class A beta-lactamase-related serine hydrolase n=1 Tax=Paenibacillus thalictri TaxID=2527873 RepID=A0A4Q9DEW2_9BACL|nr:serine hydrolase domain-containing protein [Paenibacillus thalictri]TBL70307.1 class A beta-lactamase-related serine hydrolase [Paenibacillus thalictri]
MNADTYFDRLLERKITPCLAVRVLKKGECIYEYTQGSSSLDSVNRTPVTKQTQFNVGSITKVITGALLMKLVEYGEVTLDDTVQHFLPDYPDERVRLKHLLTHTAGYEEFPAIPWPVENTKHDYLQQVLSWKPKHAPGVRMNYFTYGYSILMNIMELVADQPLELWAQEQLFVQLGMNKTTFDTTILRSGDYILPCSKDNLTADQQYDRLAVTADSGLYTTADDLMLFCRMMQHGGEANGRVIFSEAAVQRMLTESTHGAFAKTPVFWMKTAEDPYGCFGDLNSPAAVGHPGFSGCMLFLDPILDMAGVILTNSTMLHANWVHYRKMANVMMSMR